MTRSIALATVLLSVGLADAQVPPAITKVYGASAENKSITVGQVICKTLPMTESYTVDVNGKPETRTRTVMKCVYEIVQTKLSLDNATAYDGAGQKLSEQQMWQRLKPNDVVVTATGQLPDAAFLNVLRKDAIVIVLPMATASPLPPPAPGGVVPAPVVPVPTPGASPVPMPVTPIAPKTIPAPAPIPPMTATNRAAAQQHVLAGRAMLAGRKYADAIDHFRKASAADPGDPAVLYFLAYAQRENGDSDAADESVRQAVAQERSMGGDPLGFEWERFQGPARAWLSGARARAQSAKARPVATTTIHPPA